MAHGYGCRPYIRNARLSNEYSHVCLLTWNRRPFVLETSNHTKILPSAPSLVKGQDTRLIALGAGGCRNRATGPHIGSGSGLGVEQDVLQQVRLPGHQVGDMDQLP